MCQQLQKIGRHKKCAKCIFILGIYIVFLLYFILVESKKHNCFGLFGRVLRMAEKETQIAQKTWLKINQIKMQRQQKHKKQKHYAINSRYVTV